MSSTRSSTASKKSAPELPLQFAKLALASGMKLTSEQKNVPTGLES